MKRIEELQQAIEILKDSELNDLAAKVEDFLTVNERKKNIRMEENLVYVFEQVKGRLPLCASCIQHFLRVNKIRKVEKVDPFSFCGKGKIRPVLQGIYFDGKERKICASDGMVLLASTAGYDDFNAGLILDKAGCPINGRYPDYAYIVKKMHGKEGTVFPFTKDEIKEKIEFFKRMKDGPFPLHEDKTVLMMGDNYGLSVRAMKLLVNLDFDHVQLKNGGYYVNQELDMVSYSDGTTDALFLLSPYPEPSARKVMNGMICC